MAAKLEDEFQASVELIAGGGGIFDVDVNGALVYSKHQTGEFPNEESLVAELRA